MNKLIKTKYRSTGNIVEAYIEDSDGDVVVVTIECGADYYDYEIFLEGNVNDSINYALESKSVQLDEECLSELRDAVRIPLSCHA